MSADTAISYIDLLEKAFATPLSKILRSGGFGAHMGAEIDYVEESDGKLAGFEFKLREREAKALPPAGSPRIRKPRSPLLIQEAT
jgi:hypothetical protein